MHFHMVSGGMVLPSQPSGAPTSLPSAPKLRRNLLLISYFEKLQNQLQTQMKIIQDVGPLNRRVRCMKKAQSHCALWLLVSPVMGY